MKKLTKKACAFTLFTMMTLSPLGLASAETTAVPEAPEKPYVENYQDNDRINKYNSLVDSYNEAAQNYNLAVDEEYNNAVQEANKKNEEAALHNAAEEQRVKDAEARNEQAVKEAEEKNAQIDAQNAAALAQAEKDRDDQYESDMAQYEIDKAQYDYDVSIEKQILELGYASVEQYNATINYYYNEPAAKSEKMNAEAKELSAKDTYSIEEAEEKSGRMIKVTIEHIFNGTDLSYKEEIMIDANDIITVKALGSPAENTNPGYASFYYNADNAHQKGYWSESYSCVATNAKYNQYGWDCGDTHEISFKDGKNHANDVEGINVVYEYSWIALKSYRTYNTPKEPTAPVKGEVSFEKTPYVEAELEEIAQTDIWDFVAEPVKRAYLELLSHMDLFKVPEGSATEESPSTKETAKGTTPAAQTANNAGEAFAPAAEELVSIDEIEAPLAANEETAAHTVITDQATPKAEADGYWALINLIAAILTALMSIVLAVLGLKKKEEDEEEDADNKNRFRLLGILTAGISVIAFILTENMALKMQMTDKWTLVMIILLAVESVLAIASRKTKEDRDEAETELMAA